MRNGEQWCSWHRSTRASPPRHRLNPAEFSRVSTDDPGAPRWFRGWRERARPQPARLAARRRGDRALDPGAAHGLRHGQGRGRQDDRLRGAGPRGRRGPAPRRRVRARDAGTAGSSLRADGSASRRGGRARAGSGQHLHRSRYGPPGVDGEDHRPPRRGAARALGRLPLLRRGRARRPRARRHRQGLGSHALARRESRGQARRGRRALQRPRGGPAAGSAHLQPARRSGADRPSGAPDPRLPRRPGAQRDRAGVHAVRDAGDGDRGARGRDARTRPGDRPTS